MATYNFDNYTTVNMNGTEMFQVKYGTTVVYNKTLINFDEGGGDAVSNKYAYYKRAYGKLPTTSRTGHTFAGWFTGADQTGSEVLSTTVLNSVIASQTLYAAWTLKTYTVTFDKNGGTAPNPASKSVTYLSTYGTLATTSRAGHTFNGWFTALSGGTQIIPYSIVTITSDQTLYAQWIPNSYTVTFNANGGTASNPANKSVTYTSTYGTLATTSRAGHTFNGWFTASSGGTKITSASTVSTIGAHTLYAQWTPIVSTITFDSNGGATANPASKSVTYGSTYGTLATTSRTGYTFNGWFTAASGGTQITSDSIVGISSNLTLYAQWTANPYTVTFYQNGGTIPNPASKSVTYGSTYGTLATTSRTGYTFAGWFTASSGGTQVLTTTTVTTSSNHTLYARWTARSFVITLNANGGTTASNSQISVTYNTSIEAFNTNMLPTRNGYIFKGYYTSTSGGTQRISSTGYTALTNTTYSGAATLYAQWQQKTPLNTPQGSLTDKFDYQDGMDVGGVMLIGINNTNTENVILRGRILWGGGDYTSNYSHFSPADGFFFGDTFPNNTGLDYGLNVISQGLWTSDWPQPVTVEVWFDPIPGSTKRASNKLIINTSSSSNTFTWLGTYSSDLGTQDFTLPAIPDPYINANQYYDANDYGIGDIIMIPDADSYDYLYFEVV